jgi:hypothetical protein
MGPAKAVVGQPRRDISRVRRIATAPPASLLVACLWLAALLAYSNSFRGGLVMDSRGLILDDSRVHAATSANVRGILTGDYWPAATAGGLYRPLTKLTYLFNYAILGSGPSPAGYHWVNFFIHGVNMTLAYCLGLVLFKQSWHAFALAAFWGLHPLLTESVTNVVGRADLLAGFAVLAGLLCHIRSGRRKWPWLAALAGVMAIGIFSKESAAVLVAVMVIYDFTCRKFNWPAYVSVAIPLAFYTWARLHVLRGLYSAARPFTDNPLVVADFWAARLTAVKVVGRYLLLLIWPARLSCDYSYNEVPLAGWSDFGALLSLLACAGVAVAALQSLRDRRVLFFFIALFFATLLPVSNLVVIIGSVMAERFLYLPALGFAGGVVFLLRAPSPWARFALAAACTLLAVRTYARNDDWRDERSLWGSAVLAAPGSYKTHMAAAGDLPLRAAKVELERALAILDPLPDQSNTPIAYVNAGGMYRDFGDAAPPPNRAAWYRKSLDTLLRGRRIQAASGTVVWYQLYEELGETQFRLGDPDGAAISFFQGWLTDPSNASLRARLADTLRFANHDRVCALARDLRPPQPALSDLGCAQQ